MGGLGVRTPVMFIEAEDGSLVNLEACTGIVVRSGGGANDVSALLAFNNSPLHYVLATGSTERCAALLRLLISHIPSAVFRVGTPRAVTGPPIGEAEGEAIR